MFIQGKESFLVRLQKDYLHIECEIRPVVVREQEHTI